MIEGWKECTLGDAITLQRGHDLTRSKMVPGKYPVAGSNGVIGTHIEATTKGPGITIGRSGNVGNAYFYEADFWAHNTTLYVKDFKGNSEKFLYYFLTRIDFKQFNVGSAVPTLNRNHIHPLRITIPLLPEQKAIAGLLSSLDDKIDLLHRQNKTLEALAETLFRQWFVEEADDGWEEGELGDYINIAYGKNLPTTKLTKEGYPVYGGNGQIGYYTKYVYEKSQVLVACRGAACGTINICPPKSFVTNNSLALEIGKRNEITFEFLKYFSYTHDFTLYVTGSAQPQITITNMYGAEFTLPPKVLIDKFTSIVGDFEGKLSENHNQIKTLEKLRDTLLPKLMSGQVRVAYDREAA